MIRDRALCSKDRSRKFVLLVAFIVLIVVEGRGVGLDLRCVVICIVSLVFEAL